MKTITFLFWILVCPSLFGSNHCHLGGKGDGFSSTTLVLKNVSINTTEIAQKFVIKENLLYWHGTDQATLTVYDVSGQVLKKINLHTHDTIDLNIPENNIYLLQFMEAQEITCFKYLP